VPKPTRRTSSPPLRVSEMAVRVASITVAASVLEISALDATFEIRSFLFTSGLSSWLLILLIRTACEYLPCSLHLPRNCKGFTHLTHNETKSPVNREDQGQTTKPSKARKSRLCKPHYGHFIKLQKRATTNRLPSFNYYFSMC
jgi:hypothetical protein